MLGVLETRAIFSSFGDCFGLRDFGNHTHFLPSTILFTPFGNALTFRLYLRVAVFFFLACFIVIGVMEFFALFISSSAF